MHPEVGMSNRGFRERKEVGPLWMKDRGSRGEHVVEQGRALGRHERGREKLDSGVEDRRNRSGHIPTSEHPLLIKWAGIGRSSV